jgi:hypothetical protein
MTPTVIASGVTVVSSAEAATVQNRLLLRPASATLGGAPRVQARADAPIALVVTGQPASTDITVQIKVDRRYSQLGVVRSDRAGMAALPVFTVSSPGTYTIALTTDVSTRYLRVVVS